MSGCRQCCSIWFYIKCVISPYFKNAGMKYRWRSLKRLMLLKFNDYYFWHDSFGKYINKFILCPILGHKEVSWLSDGGCETNSPEYHCFRCESEVDPGIDKIKSFAT